MGENTAAGNDMELVIKTLQTDLQSCNGFTLVCSDVSRVSKTVWTNSLPWPLTLFNLCHYEVHDVLIVWLLGQKYSRFCYSFPSFSFYLSLLICLATDLFCFRKSCSMFILWNDYTSHVFFWSYIAGLLCPINMSYLLVNFASVLSICQEFVGGVEPFLPWCLF